MSETIKIQYLNDEVKRLSKIEKGDWIDLYTAEDYDLFEGKLQLLHLGVAMKLPEGYEAHIVPRSSTFKNFQIIQSNHQGVVDNSYCGPNDWWYFPAISMKTGQNHIPKGSKICQFRIMKKQPDLVFDEVEKLDGNDRGGFGSTGTK